MTYTAKSPVLGRPLFTFDTDCTLKLRGRCRAHIGRRRSVKMRYRQIGSNSFVVETERGRRIMDVYGT